MKMKRFHIIIILVSLLIGNNFFMYAQQLPSEGIWGAKNKATLASGEVTLTGDIYMKGPIRVAAGKSLVIKSNKDVTIYNDGIVQVDVDASEDGMSRMFTINSASGGNNAGILRIEASEGATITIDGGADFTWENYRLQESSKTRTLHSCFATSGTLTLTNVTIQNVKDSNNQGGAFDIGSKSGGPVTLNGCKIIKCYSERGAAIFTESGQPLIINDSEISYCNSGGGYTNNSGGAIRTLGNTKGDMILKSVTFKYNYAQRNKGYDNHLYRDGNGGALFWNGRGAAETACYIDGCTFLYNKCDDNGGAIKAQGSIKFINNKTTIQENTAPFGAGIFIEGYTGSVHLPNASSIKYDLNENLELINNSATSYTYEGENNPGKGAGIHFCFNDQMTLEDKSSIEVAINGVSITGNKISGEGGLGGGIYFENTSLAIHDYTFQINLNYGTISGNSSTSKGGGIYVYKEKVEANAVDAKTLTVSGNKSGYGAGIYIEDGSLEMAHGTITDNHTTGSGNGGGIYIENGDFTIKDGEISGNSVNNGNGGGVYILGSKEGDKITGNFTMDGSGSIKDNSASGNGKNVGFGGGIYVNGGNFTLTENATDGEISNNSSTQDGGGVYINGGQFIQNKGDISSNTSRGNGGGVCIVNGGTFTMSGGMITANGKEGQTIHTQNGGGVYLNGGNFVLENGTISNNGAAVNGGGVFLTGENCTYQLQKGDITGNSAGNGGGVYLEKGLFKLGTSGNILDGNISNNAAQFGGGVYIGSGSTSSVSDDASDEPTEGFIMYGGKITGNSTTDDGGGIYLNGGSFLMYNGDIISNSSLTVGGGVCIANNGNLTMNNGNITQNGLKTGTVVTENGGGVYLDGGSLTVNAGNISENSATASGGGVYISNGNVGMQTGKILSNSCGEYGGGIYVYNPVGSTSKTVSVTGGSLLENTAKYGGGICVDGLIVLTIGNVEIAENTATNGGGVCLMNNADMIFGAGQIKNNKAVKSESSQIYTGVTGFEKDIETVEGLGGGLYLNSNTTLVFSDATELGLFGNTADNGADEIFANGSGTSVILPDVTGMKLDGYPGAGNLKWIEDYITNDTGYASGTKLKGQRWDEEKTNIRYRNAISNNDQDNIFNLEKGTTEDDRTKYICFALGYEVIYVTITRHGLADGESAVYTLSKSGTDESENFSVILTGNGNESVSKSVAVTAGVWTVKEELWNWTYDFTPVNDLLGYVPDEDSKEEIEDGDIVVDAGNRFIKKNIAKSFNRNFIFKGNKQEGIPMNAEAIVVNIMGN